MEKNKKTHDAMIALNKTTIAVEGPVVVRRWRIGFSCKAHEKFEEHRVLFTKTIHFMPFGFD